MLKRLVSGRRRTAPKVESGAVADVNLFTDLDNLYRQIGYSRHTFVLLPLQDVEPEILQIMYRILLDVDALQGLQQCGAINAGMKSQWADWDSSDRELQIRCRERPLAALLPARVAGDGNCLLHAISKALWGVHDYPVTKGPFQSGPSETGIVGIMREGLRTLLNHPYAGEMLKQVWKEQKAVWDKECGIAECSEAQVEQEWETEILKRACNDRSSLCELHIYALAHVIRRPIIVYASDMAGAPDLGVRCYFRGIYLPTLLSASQVACRTNVPILLGYDSSHFVPLVCHLPGGDAGGNGGSPVIPLDCPCNRPSRRGQRERLPVNFCVGEDHDALLSRFFDLSSNIGDDIGDGGGGGGGGGGIALAARLHPPGGGAVHAAEGPARMLLTQAWDELLAQEMQQQEVVAAARADQILADRRLALQVVRGGDGGGGTCAAAAAAAAAVAPIADTASACVALAERHLGHLWRL